MAAGEDGEGVSARERPRRPPGFVVIGWVVAVSVDGAVRRAGQVHLHAG